MSQQKDNSGVLFRNTKKTKPAQPDFTGSVTIQGLDYRMAAWIKTSNADKPVEYWSFAFTRVSETGGEA